MSKEIKEEEQRELLVCMSGSGTSALLKHIIQNMSKQDAIIDIGNIVYEACALFEVLEGEGKIRGNGHHARQEVANFAKQVLLLRWNENERV